MNPIQRFMTVGNPPPPSGQAGVSAAPPVDRRLALETFVAVLAKSKVRTIVNLEMLQQLLENSSPAMWRRHVLDLEFSWKILTHEPGLTATDLAPLFLAFSSYDDELGIDVSLPAEIADAPRSERVILRQALELSDALVSEVRTSIEERRRAAAAADQMAQVVQQLRAGGSGSVVAPSKVSSLSDERDDEDRKGWRDWATIALGCLSCISVLGVGGYLILQFRSHDKPVTLPELKDALQLSDASRIGSTLAARIVDPRWPTMTAADRRRALGVVYDRELAKGVEAIALRDGSDRLVATVGRGEGAPYIELF